jgi:hypothetical protein
MADSLFDYVQKNQDSLATPEDDLFSQAVGEAAKTPTGQVAGALSKEADELEMLQAPQGLGTDLANVLKRMPGQVVSGARRTLGGAADVATEIARGQEKLFNIDAPGDTGAQFWGDTAETLEEQSTLQGFEANKQDMIREKELPLVTEPGKIMGEVGQSMAAMAPALAVGAISGNPMAATFVMGHQTGLETFHRAKQEGASTEAAMGQAVMTGAAEGIFETLPTGMLFSWFKKGKKGFAKHLTDYFKYVGAEIATEIPTTYVQNAAEIFYSQADANPEKGLQDAKAYLSGKRVQVGQNQFDMWEDTKHTALVTALQSTILGGLGKGAAGVHRKLEGRREEKAVNAENQATAAKVAADHMGARVNEEANARQDVVFTEAEAESIRRGERTVEDVTAGHREVSVNDDAQTMDDVLEEEAQENISTQAEEQASAIDEEANEKIDKINSFTEEMTEDAEQEAAGRKKVITNWATGEWEWSDNEEHIKDEESLDRHESPAADDLGVDVGAFRSGARQVYASVKSFAEFSRELVKKFGAKVKKHAAKLWNGYKKSKFSSQKGAVGDIENVPQDVPVSTKEVDIGQGYEEEVPDYEPGGFELDAPVVKQDPEQEAIDKGYLSVADMEMEESMSLEDKRRSLPVYGDTEEKYGNDELRELAQEGNPQAQAEIDRRYINEAYVDFAEWTRIDDDQNKQEVIDGLEYLEETIQRHEKFAQNGKRLPFLAKVQAKLKALQPEQIAPPKAKEKKPVSAEKPKKKSHIDRETKDEKDFGVGGESGIDAKKTKGPQSKTIKAGKKAHELTPKTDEAKADALKREEENIKLEREIEELVNKARTDKELTQLFDAIERKNQIEHRTGDAPSGAETEAELSGYVSLAKDDGDLDIEAPFKAAVHKGEDTGSPEMRLIRQQELRFSGIRTIKDIAYWRSRPTRSKSERQRTDYGFRKSDVKPMTNKELTDYREFQKEEKQKQAKMTAQVLILLTNNKKLMITDHNVKAHTMQQIMKAIDQKKKLPLTTPRDEIFNDLRTVAKSFYLGDAINFIKKEEGIHSLAQLEGYPPSLTDLLQRAKQGVIKEADHVENRLEVVEQTAAQNKNAVYIYEKLLDTVFGKLNKEQADNIMKNSKRASTLFSEINRGQFKANERALSLLLTKPDQVLAFFEANLYANGKYEDKKWFKEQLTKDFGVEFGKEITKKGHSQSVNVTPVVMDALIEWSKLERKSMRAEDKKAMESYIENMMQGRLPKNEEEAVMDKAIADGVKVATALENARKNKGKVAITQQEKVDQVKSDARRIGVRTPAPKTISEQKLNKLYKLLAATTRADVPMYSRLSDRKVIGSIPNVSRANKEHIRKSVQNGYYNNLLDTMGNKLFGNRVAAANAGTFYRAVMKQANQGRHGKANFLNVEDIARKMADEAKAHINAPAFKAMSEEQRKNDPAMLFQRLSIPKQEELVKFYITMSEPRTGTWEAKFFNDEVADLGYDPEVGFTGGVSFTAENVLETYTIPARASFTQIDPSVERTSSTPTINEQGFTLYDIEIEGHRLKGLSKTEMEEYPEGAYEIVKERKSNQGKLIEVQFYSGKTKYEQEGWRDPILMTEAQFDKMERNHDDATHEKYRVLKQPEGSTPLTVENAGMGKMISGWDFLNNIQALADRANELRAKDGSEVLPKNTYSEIQYDLETSRVIDLLLETPEGEQLDSDLLDMIDPLTGKNESGEQISEKEELTAMKWANKGKDSRLAANMIVVKSLLMSEQIKKDTIRNPEWFDKLAEHYADTGNTPADWLRIYLEEAGGNRDIFMTKVKQEIMNAHQKRADNFLLALKTTGESKGLTLGLREARGYVVSQLNERQQKLYYEVARGDKLVTDLNTRDYSLITAYTHLESRLISLPPAKEKMSSRKGIDSGKAYTQEQIDKYDALAAGELSIADFLKERKVEPKVWDFFTEKATLDAYESKLNVSVGEMRDPDAKAFYDSIAKAFGVDFILVSDPSYRSQYDPNNGKPKIVVNVQSDTSFHKVMGHEIFHHVVNRASRGQIDAFKKAARAISNKNLDEMIKQYKEKDPVNGEEEAYAEIFAEVFTHRDFYTHLADTFDGRSLGAKIIARLVDLVGKVQQLLKNPVAIRFEGKILFETSDMESLYEIMGDLIGGTQTIKGRTKVGPNLPAERLEGVLNPDGTLNHNQVRHHTVVGYRMQDELKGYLAKPALWLKGGTWDRIFAPGTKGYKGVMTNLENMILDALDWLSKVKPSATWADWRANPDAVDLAQMPVNGSTQAEGKAYVSVVQKFKDVFKGYSDEQLEKMHDDFVRGVKVEYHRDEDAQAALDAFRNHNQDTVMLVDNKDGINAYRKMNTEERAKWDGKIAQYNRLVKEAAPQKQTIKTGGINVGTKGKPNKSGIRKAKALGYSEAVIEVFQEYKAIADQIHSELAAFYPELTKRETHYGQSLRWRRADGTYLKDDSEAIIEDEFSRMEGNKSYMETKNTQDSTRTIAEDKNLKYDHIDPHKVFLAYVRESNKLIQLGKMMEKGQKEGLIKIFANPKEMKNAGFKSVNDPAFIISRMTLSKGFKVKVNEDKYANVDGQDAVFSTKDEAQEFIDSKLRPMENSAIYSAEIEETKPDTILSRHKYSVKRINSKGESQGIIGFDSKKLAEEYVAERYEGLEEGKDYIIEPSYTESQMNNVAEYGFHPDLAKLLNNVLAKDWLLESKIFGMPFKWLYDVKNHMTSVEFAVSMFHAATITQEAVATQTAWAAQRYGKKHFAKGLHKTYDDSQDIHSLLMAVLDNPELVQEKGIQNAAEELFGTTDVDVLDVVNQFFLSGGLLHMDPTTRSSAHGLGEMRYYKDTPTLEVMPETVRFGNRRLFGRHGVGDLIYGISPEEIKDSIKEVWDREINNEPDKKIKAAFNTMRFGALQGATSWLMETGIPKVKMAAFAREYTLQLDKQKEAIESGQVSKDKIARFAMKFVEDKFGEVNWKNQWMHPSLSTALKFLFRSFTWFTGSYKALSKAGIDIGKLGWFTVKQADKTKPWNKQYELTSEGMWGITAVLTHIMSVAMVTAAYNATLAITGDDEVPDDPDTPLLTKLLYPRYDPSDPTARVTIPSYVTEGYKIFRHIGVIGDEPELSKLVSGRFNSLLRNSYETFVTGTDWQGTMVRNPNDSLAEQSLDSFIHLFGVSPISISAMQSQFKRKGFTPEVLMMSLVGMTDAPAAAKRSDAVNYGYHLSRGAHTTQKTEEEADQKAEVQRAQAAAARGNKQPLLKLKRDGKISKRQYGRILKKIPRFGSRPNPAYVPEINRVVNLLTVPDTIKLIAKMSTHERKLTESLIRRKYHNMVKRKEHGAEYVERQRNALKQLGYRI